MFLDDYPQFNFEVLIALLQYLEALGLVERTSREGWRATIVGRTVFQRWGGFAIVDSYERYFAQLDDLLVRGIQPAQIAVNRKKNVIGSGQLHARKFFPTALNMLAAPPDTLVDIGCGDGSFLEAAFCRYPNAGLVAVDLSSDSIHLANERLATKVSSGWRSAVADGADVTLWSQAVPKDSGRTVITAWFVLHEFCGATVDKARQFFLDIHRYLPTAEVLIGEVVKASSKLLAREHGRTVLPEFQLFHALSGQGLLDWEQLKALRAAIPYDISAESLIDPVQTSHGSVPANVIWHLKPRANAPE